MPGKIITDSQLVILIREYLQLMQERRNTYGPNYDLKEEQEYLNFVIQINQHRKHIVIGALRTHNNYLALISDLSHFCNECQSRDCCCKDTLNGDSDEEILQEMLMLN